MRSFLSLLLVSITLISTVLSGGSLGGTTDSTTQIEAVFPTEKSSDGFIFARGIGDSYTVRGYEGDNTDLVIPEEYNGKKVARIKSRAFINNTAITSVTIPDSVTNIGSSAFAGCGNLKSATLGEGVTNINAYAFKDCVSLESITIPDSVTNIGYDAFIGCCALAKVINCSSLNLQTGSTAHGCVGYYATKIYDTNTPLYTFGVLSDIHLKDSAFGEDTADSLNDYARALTFFKNNDVDFVCVNGDIVANSWKNFEAAESGNAPAEWLSELRLFKEYNNTYIPDIPIYAVTGNHDANIWGYSHAANGMQQIVSSYEDGTKTAEQVWEEIVGTPLRFKIEMGDDVLLFVPMYYWHYAQLFRNSDLEWLTNELEANKEKRVFLFFHPALNGTYDVDCDGMSQTLTHYKLPAVRELVNNYSNVIWFTGHSHYDLWREGGVQPDGETPYVNPNVYQSGNSMTMVHTPSCAFIRHKNAAGSTVRDYPESQGLLVEVYLDRVVVNGIDFTLGDGGDFIEPATYIINTK